MTGMVVTVEFVGALRHAAGTDKVRVNCQRVISIRELIKEVTAKAPKLKLNIPKPQLEDRGINTLILVNSKEISVLNGLETKLKDGDEAVFVPVVHGG